MTQKVSELFSAAMALTEEERCELAEMLLESAGPPDPHAGMTDEQFA
jgi:hypothetical protein